MHDESEEKKKTPHNNENRQIEKALLCEENNAVESWRIFKIMAEFVSGFEVLRRYDLAVTFFGSARSELGDRIYEHTTELAYKLSKSGFTVITGGGGGVMEAANIGATKNAGSNSVGLNIKLPKEQILNKYVTDSEGFHYFFTRKVMLAFASEVYVFMPGGFGTLDELFELVTLIQTKKIKRLPIILFGRDHWEPLISWVEKELYSHLHAVDKEDMEIYHLVDSVEEAYDVIMELTEGARKKIGGRRRQTGTE